MAASMASPATIDRNIKQPESENPIGKPDPPSTSAPPLELQQQLQPPPPPLSAINPNANATPISTPTPTPNPNPNPNPTLNQTPTPVSLPPPPVQSYAPLTQPISYRIPIPTAGQFSPVHNYQNPGVHPPGVGGVAVTVPQPMMQYPVLPGQPPNMALRPYPTMPNGYGGVPPSAPGCFLQQCHE